MFGCRSCDYDLCADCHAAPLVMNCRGRHGLVQFNPKESPSQLYSCDLCLSPIQERSQRCTICDFDVCQACYCAPKAAACSSGHTLRAFRTPGTLTSPSYFCDRCNSRAKGLKEIMYGCRQCDYDLCAECYVLSSAAANPDKIHVSSIIEMLVLMLTGLAWDMR